MKRNLDGIYYRVKRGEKYENVCLSDLTKEERLPFLMKLEKDGLIRCIDHLCDCLKEIGDFADIVKE